MFFIKKGGFSNLISYLDDIDIKRLKFLQEHLEHGFLSWFIDRVTRDYIFDFYHCFDDNSFLSEDHLADLGYSARNEET